AAGATIRRNAPYERGASGGDRLGRQPVLRSRSLCGRGLPLSLPGFQRLPTRAKFNLSKIAVTGRRAVLGRYRQANGERECRTARVCPRGQNGDGREVPEALLIAPRLGDRCELAVEPTGAPPELERAWLHMEVENQAAAPGVCP